MKKLHIRLDEITVKNRQEYNKRSTELQKNMQLKGEVRHTMFVNLSEPSF